MKNFKGTCCFYNEGCKDKRCDSCELIPEMTNDQFIFITESVPVGILHYIQERVRIKETNREKFIRLIKESNDGSYSYQTGKDRENDKTYFILQELISCAERIICDGEK